MRYFIVASLLVLSGLSATAFADQSAPSNENTPQCSQIQLDGKTTTACFGLSDDQVQSLNIDQNAQMERCEVRCVESDPWGRCRRWRRFCW